MVTISRVLAAAMLCVACDSGPGDGTVEIFDVECDHEYVAADVANGRTVTQYRAELQTELAPDEVNRVTAVACGTFDLPRSGCDVADWNCDTRPMPECVAVQPGITLQGLLVAKCGERADGPDGTGTTLQLLWKHSFKTVTFRIAAP